MEKRADDFPLVPGNLSLSCPHRCITAFPAEEDGVAWLCFFQEEHDGFLPIGDAVDFCTSTGCSGDDLVDDFFRVLRVGIFVRHHDDIGKICADLANQRSFLAHPIAAASGEDEEAAAGCELRAESDECFAVGCRRYREIDEDGERLPLLDPFHATGNSCEGTEGVDGLPVRYANSLSTCDGTEGILDVEGPRNVQCEVVGSRG